MKLKKKPIATAVALAWMSAVCRSGADRPAIRRWTARSHSQPANRQETRRQTTRRRTKTSRPRSSNQTASGWRDGATEAAAGEHHSRASDAAACRGARDTDPPRIADGDRHPRRHVEQSLEAKRNADSVVEVITAEDIGKMPDKNIADSLQRVPGVTISSASRRAKAASTRTTASACAAPIPA